MKQILAIILGCFFTVAALAQTVSIKVNGNKNKKIIVNGVTYNIDNTTTSSASRTITIPNLQPGQHTIQVIRNTTGSLRGNTTTSFTLRSGYDVSIVVAANGGVQVRQKKGTTTAVNRTPMTDANFNNVLRGIQNNIRNSSKYKAAQSAFSNTSYYFTTNQAMQIIQSVAGDANKLELAKISYARITDPNNFIQIYNLMPTQAAKDELASYIRAQTGRDIVNLNTGTNGSPMVDNENFETIIANLQRQYNASDRVNTVTQLFANENNYFTTTQVRRLIELIDSESSRLHLLKDAYRHVTDPANFSQLYYLLGPAARVQLETYINAGSGTVSTSPGALTNYNANRVAMGDADFLLLYNKSRAHFRSSSILTDVTNAFANTSYFFTSAQAAQMIALVTGEANRLALAKSAYRSIVDPHNYLAQVNNLLTLQASRDELKNYVYAYRGY